MKAKQAPVVIPPAGGHWTGFNEAKIYELARSLDKISTVEETNDDDWDF